MVVPADVHGIGVSLPRDRVALTLIMLPTLAPSDSFRDSPLLLGVFANSLNIDIGDETTPVRLPMTAMLSAWSQSMPNW